MAKSTPDLAALLQSLSQPAQPDIWQALGSLGQGLSAAGRTTVGRPAQETVGGALGGFAGSLAQTRQQDQANKLRQLQTLSAVSQLQAVDKKQKRDKYFEDIKDDLVRSFKSIMPTLQYETLQTMAKFGDSDTVLNYIKDFAKTDATGQAAARIAQIKGDFQNRGQIAKNNRDFADKIITKEQWEAKNKLLTTRGSDIVKSLTGFLERQEGAAVAKIDVKTAQDFRERATTAASMATLTSSAADMLERHQGDVQGFSRALETGTSGLKAQVTTQAKKLFSGNDFSSETKAAVNGDIKALDALPWGNLAGQGAAFKSTMLSLAMLRARVDEKGRLSDDDVKRAIAGVGADYSSPDAALGAMFSSMRGSVDRLENEMEIGMSEGAQKHLGNLTGGKFRNLIKKRLGKYSGPVFSGTFGPAPSAGAGKVLRRRKVQ